MERGIVRSGFCTSPAGTVADSSPRYANMVSGASAALDSSSDLPLGLKSPSRFHLTKKRPTIEMATNGTSFVYVVTSAKMPASFTPRRFSSVTSQIARQRDGHADRPVALQRRQQLQERAGEGHRDHRQRRPDRDPVAPGDEEPGEVAVAQPGVGVRTAGRRRHAGQARERQAQADGADAHDDPREDREQTVGRHRRWRQVEPRSHHVADHDGRAGGEAEALGGCQAP